MKTGFHQSELMILKNIRLNEDIKHQINCYYKGEIIGSRVEDVSFYTKTQTGAVIGWPEIRLGLGKATYWLLYSLILPIEVVWGVRNAGDGNAVFKYPLFE